jgi:alkaline phosphatase D
MNPKLQKNSISEIFAWVLFISCSFSIYGKDSANIPVYKIAFGSCLDQGLDKNIWIPIIKSRPDLWIWLGDNIYKDTVEMSEKKLAYDLQKSNEQYVRLREKTKIIGTWDDHDFGANDVGSEYPMKKESKNLFLDFLDVQANSPMRRHEGIFSSEQIIFDKMTIKIILLDTRTFRTELKVNPLPNLGGKEYIGNEDPNATILGKEQWSWLEKELGEKSDLYIIVSSIQVLNDTHRFEKWSNFPNERTKLLTLLDKYAAKKSIILSGDRHIAEIFEENLPSGIEIADITSSSMNKPIPSRSMEREDSRRKSKIFAEENFGLLEISRQKKSINIKLSIQGFSGPAILRSYLFPLADPDRSFEKQRKVKKR